MQPHRELFIAACLGWQFTGGQCPNPIDALLDVLGLQPTGPDYSVDWLKKELDDGVEPEVIFEKLQADLDKLDRLKCEFKPVTRLRRKPR